MAADCKTAGKDTFFPKRDKLKIMCYNGANDNTGGIAMSRGIFHPDSALMITMTQITDCIFLSLFWLVGCLPVVTAGASFAALYDAVYHGFRRGDKHCWQRFAHSFRSNWKAGIGPTAVVLAGGLVLGKTVIALWNAAAAGSISWMLFSGGAFVAVLLLGVLSLVFPVLSRFENGFSGLMKNSVLLALANLPRTLGLGILNAMAVLLCLMYVVPLFFLPALAALLGTLFVEPMFKPYLPEETE